MYKIIDKRASGKTLRLMLIAKEKNAVFVCENPQKTQEKALAYGLTGIKFIGYDEILTDGARYGTVVIDEIDIFVSKLLAQSNCNLLEAFSICTD